jgi:CTP synthase (UTP-ammonia lyase)
MSVMTTDSRTTDARAATAAAAVSAPATAASRKAPRRATARIALVGDRSPAVRSHQRVPGLLDALRRRHALPVEGYWIPTQDARSPGAVRGFDAVWLLPGSPYRSEAGALTAVRTARESGIPFLGTCGGFQHALLEFARTVCGLTTARHAENDPRPPEEADDLLIGPLACSLVGHEGRLTTVPGSRAEQLLGSRESVERVHCAYGPVPALLPLLADSGLRFTGHDSEGEPRIAELPGHPFYLATLFQPELAGDGTEPHPFVTALAEAAVTHAAQANSPAKSRFDEESPGWPVHSDSTAERIRTQSL